MKFPSLRPPIIYRPGRSTTEHVFAMKALAERAANSKDEEIYIALMDMSKAYDCINRNQLLEDLGIILHEDELFFVKVLLDTELSARCGKFKSSNFKTDTGAPQGDCLSATEFTFCFAKTLEPLHTNRAVNSYMTQTKIYFK